MNSTNQNNGASATNTPNASAPYRATLHPTLRSLWNIPHVIQIPDPMPAPPEVLQLMQKQIARCEKQIAALDATNPDHFSTIGACKSKIAILKHKIEEVLNAFPDLDEDRSAPATAAAAPNVEQTSNNLPASTAHTVQNNFSPVEPEQNSGQNSQPPPPQETQTRTQPELTPNSTRTQPEQGRTQSEHTANKPEPTQTQTEPIAPSPSSPTAPTQTAPPAGNQPIDDDSPPNIQSTDEAYIEAAADLYYHIKGRSPFDKLTPQQQETIIHLMEHHEEKVVRKIIAQPSPLGFSFKIGKTAFYAFLKRHRDREAERQKQQRIEQTDAYIQLMTLAPDPSQAFGQIFERLVQIKALKVASDPQISLAVCDAVITTVNKLRKQSLAERKQSHAEKPK
ncbi:MAG TPA: hypothetical protein VI282_11270 [Verrucomicrobiae bacterium]